MAALFGCGGGGGGGSDPSFVEQPLSASPAASAPTDTAFTSFAVTPANQIVVMDGIAVTASGTHTTAPDGDVTITSTNFNPVGSGNASLTFDADRKVRAVSINTPQSSVAFDRDAAGHRLLCEGPVCAASNPNARAFAANPLELEWNYQTFGVWANEATATSWTAGAISVGAPTAGNALPTTGEFTFRGAAAGLFTNSGGEPFSTLASVRAQVNFGTRNIALSTSNTSTLNVNTGALNDDSSLNLDGTLTYAPGVNSFAGTLNAGNGMTGQGSGRFYGPAAQEMGGVYRLEGGAGRMLGGFGAKQQ